MLDKTDDEYEHVLGGTPPGGFPFLITIDDKVWTPPTKVNLDILIMTYLVWTMLTT